MVKIANQVIPAHPTINKGVIPKVYGQKELMKLAGSLVMKERLCRCHLPQIKS